MIFKYLYICYFVIGNTKYERIRVRLFSDRTAHLDEPEELETYVEMLGSE